MADSFDHFPVSLAIIFAAGLLAAFGLVAVIVGIMLVSYLFG